MRRREGVGGVPVAGGEGPAPATGTGAAAALAFGLVTFGAAVAAYVLMVLAHPHALWTMSDLKVYRWGGLLARHSHRLYDETIGGFGFTYPPIAPLHDPRLIELADQVVELGDGALTTVAPAPA